MRTPDLPDAAARALASVAGRAEPGPTLRGTARVVLHFHPDADVLGRPVLREILSNGRYVSQFVTRTGNGGLTAFPGGDRWAWEHRTFSGAYDDVPPDVRPVYGALDPDGDPYGAAPRFGSASLRLRPGVVARSTFVFPDSVHEPTSFGVADRMGVLRDLERAEVLDPLDHDVEAHAHGGIRVPEDVEAVVVDPSFDDEAALALAGGAGLPVATHPGYAATADEIGAHPDYRGPQVAALARRLVGPGPPDTRRPGRGPG
ncbi:hypothetical protein GCM10025864_34860 [Luteimicrobium album]|uniref:DUF3626 domain-containing protein n=1 Tax=Luteimicrobium album TaxID=1054550 RepID=A0ABQ6I692_9MICO|nr:DUF3626 domain-containing protein [Luteimicrobium album]GMA25727.1 hypothetical protein GCM10025864_34860 [Luteimicrobium album]